MIYGSNYIYQCPTCKNLLQNRSLISGNTSGAKWFSDGKQIARMLPEFPNLTKCKKCDTIFWLTKLKELGTFEWGDIDKQDWQNADEAEFLNIDDYFRAIDLKVAENEDEEYFIKQRIWWAFNDRVRESSEIFVNENDESLYRGNCFALIYLLDIESDNQKTTIGELYRNMGDFEKCINIIESIQDEELKWLVDKLRNECMEKNRWVIELS